MDGVDWLRTQLAAFRCAACGRAYGAAHIRVLAQRDELFFVDLACPECRSAAVAIVSVELEGEEAQLEVGELAEAAGFAESPPVSADDVLEMHAFLRRFDGDFRRLFGPQGPADDRRHA
ncbi:MAG TPA: hypothetical protein VFK38_00705 [Candidatus Limnocylindrales bacterium]|nr:hypothetical protein [Candidatus Limnocylindrales bacterium]